ncbi:50S ribosomal protein L33 [Candidatus Shapirobacteria bacterium]|nr:50S ribosomal protein L33 [Candidatus Shapirobacteria bacterium]
MAKKGNRLILGLLCSVCNNFNYITERNRVNTTEKLKMQKYCKACKKKTEHKETTKLK